MCCTLIRVFGRGLGDDLFIAFLVFVFISVYIFIIGMFVCIYVYVINRKANIDKILSKK